MTLVVASTPLATILGRPAQARYNGRTPARQARFRMVATLPDYDEFARRYRLSESAFDTSVLPLPANSRDVPLPLPMRVEMFWRREHYSAFVPMNLFQSRQVAGRFDRPAFSDCLAALMQRHEALRTRLDLRNSVPSQIVQPGGVPPVEVVDLSGTPAADRQDRAATLLAEFIESPLNLMSGPTFRVLVLTAGNDCFVLGILLHHYFGDARSMEIVTTELLTLYAAAIHGVAASLPPVLMQYTDYAIWQRKLAITKGPEYIRNLRTQLQLGGSRSDVTEVTVDRGNNAGTAFNIDAQLVAGLNHIARSLNASAFPLLLAAHQVALARWTGRNDALIAVPFAARTRTEFASSVGYMINAMPIGPGSGDAGDLAGRVRHIRKAILNALLWQDISYELLEQCVCEHPPLCRTMFNFIPMRTPGGTQLVNGLTVTDFLPLLLLEKVANRKQVRVVSDFVFYLREAPQGLACDLLYNGDRYTSSDMQDYGGCFITALGDIVSRSVAG
jgi:Condensation domain